MTTSPEQLARYTTKHERLAGLRCLRCNRKLAAGWRQRYCAPCAAERRQRQNERNAERREAERAQMELKPPGICTAAGCQCRAVIGPLCAECWEYGQVLLARQRHGRAKAVAA